VVETPQAGCEDAVRNRRGHVERIAHAIDRSEIDWVKTGHEYLPRPDELDPALPSPSSPQDISPQFKSEDGGDDIAD
jgi:hypothetical protein